MFTRLFATFQVLGLVCVLVGPLQSQDKPTVPLPRDHKDVVGKVKSTDLKDNTFTITLPGKQVAERTFGVTKDTKFIGPRGGASEEGLKDDRMEPGHEVRVVYPIKDAKTAAEVYLPYRKKEEPKK